MDASLQACNDDFKKLHSHVTGKDSTRTREAPLQSENSPSHLACEKLLVDTEQFPRLCTSYRTFHGTHGSRGK